MKPKDFVILACGHSYIVDHKEGERLVLCKFPEDDGPCMKESIVIAESVTTIEYKVREYHSQQQLQWGV